MKNVAVISLGCDKNRIDTEHMLYRISRGGHAVSDIADADVIIINTCAFIESAKQESIDTILECAELKKTGKAQKLIVTGCLPQKYRDELIPELPEVDCFLGAFEYDKILAAIDGTAAEGGQSFCDAENMPRLLTTYPHTAYIKIAEGCDNKCTFCTIPSIRGPFRSRTVADIVKEAEGLVDDGVGELVLVAQDVARFGEDRGRNELTELLTALKKLPLRSDGVGLYENGIRLLYCYPERVTDGLIDILSSGAPFCPYIDIPMQHCSDRILKLMNRRTSHDKLVELVDKLHGNSIAVRTTLMVGFPGETESDFEELCEFVKQTKPENVGIFAYSEEEDTPSAKLPGKVPAEEKLRRVEALGKICADISREKNAALVGKTLPVVYENIDYDKNLFIGRAPHQAPGVDGLTYFRSKTPVNVGDVYGVKIERSDDYDLYGEV